MDETGPLSPVAGDKHPGRADPANGLGQLERVIDKLRTVPAGVLIADPGLAEHWALTWFEKIELLYALERYREMAQAARSFQESWQDFGPGQARGEPGCWHWLSRAGCEEARALMALDEDAAALAVVQRLQSVFEAAQALPVRHSVARAGRLEVHIRAGMGATFARVDMVRRCDELVQSFQDDDWPGTRLEVVRIRWAKAQMLRQLDYADEALRCYDAIWQDCAATRIPELGEVFADARLDQALLLRRLGRADEAEVCRQDVIRQFGDSTHAGTRASVALARLRQIEWLERDDSIDPDERDAQLLQAYAALIACHEAPQSAAERRFVNIAWRRRSELTRALDDDAAQGRAAAWAREQWRRWSGDADTAVQAQVLEAMVDDLYASPCPWTEQLAVADEILARFGASRADDLQPWLARLELLRAELLSYVDRRDEALAALSALENRWQAAPRADARQQAAMARLQRFQLLQEAGGDDEALALVHTPSVQLPSEAEPDSSGLRYARVRLLAEGLESWRQRLPAPAEAEDDSTPMVDADRPPAEAAQVELLDALLAQFAADPDPRIRREAVEAGYLFAVQQREHRRPSAAVQTYTRLEAVFDADGDPEVQRRLASVRLNHGYALMILLERPDEALPVYDALLARHAQATDPALRDTLAKAAASRHTCLNRLQARGVDVDYGSQYEELPLEKRRAIQAIIDRGGDASEKGRYREAIARYDEVLNTHLESLHPELRRLCLDALVRKAYTLVQAGDREASLAVNEEAIARYGADLSTEMEKDVALAMTNKVADLSSLGRFDEKLAVCEAVIERWQDSSIGYLRGRVASAWYSRAYSLAERDRAAAEQAYRALLEYGLGDSEPAVQLQAFKGAVNLNALLRELGRAHEAAALSEDVLGHCDPRSTDEAVQAQRAKLLWGLALSHALTGDKSRQLACYDELLQSPAKSIDVLQRREFRQERRKLAAQMWFGRLGGLLKGRKTEKGAIRTKPEGPHE